MSWEYITMDTILQNNVALHCCKDRWRVIWNTPTMDCRFSLEERVPSTPPPNVQCRCDHLWWMRTPPLIWSFGAVIPIKVVCPSSYWFSCPLSFLVAFSEHYRLLMLVHIESPCCTALPSSDRLSKDLKCQENPLNSSRFLNGNSAPHY